MSDPGVNDQTGNNNEDKSSEDVANSNSKKTSPSEQELDQIIGNMASGSSGDHKMIDPNDNEDKTINKSIIEAPSPNDSESQDEDLLLRWDEDDDDDQNSQDKIDENILYELDSFDGVSVKTDDCVLLDSDNDKSNPTDVKLNTENINASNDELTNIGVSKDVESDDSDDIIISNPVIEDPTIILSDDETSDKNEASNQENMEKLSKNDESKYCFGTLIPKTEANELSIDTKGSSNIDERTEVTIKAEITSEEKDDDDNIDFLKQQLKVLSESINPNLNMNSIDIDVSNIMGDELDTNKASTSGIGALDAFSDTASNEDVKTFGEIDVKPNLGVDVDVFPKVSEQISTSNETSSLKDDSNKSKDYDLMRGIKMEIEINSENIKDSVFIKEEKSTYESNEDDVMKNVMTDIVKSEEFKDITAGTNKTIKKELETKKEHMDKNNLTSGDKIVSSESNNVEIDRCIKEEPIPSEVKMTNIEQTIECNTDFTKQKDTNKIDSQVLDQEMVEDVPETIRKESEENVNEKSIDNKTTDPELMDVDTSETVSHTKTDTEKEIETKQSEGMEVESQEEIGTDNTNVDAESNINVKTSTQDAIEDNTAITNPESDSKLECDNYVDLRSQSPISLDNEPTTTEKVESGDSKSTKVDKDSTDNKDLNYYNVKTDHIHKPDVMIEIPVHNLIDIDDTLDIDSEETSQDAEIKLPETDNQKADSTIVTSAVNAVENVEKKGSITEEKLPETQAKDNLNNPDVIDVDMDEDSVGDTIKEKNASQQEKKTDSVEDNKDITEPKDISNKDDKTESNNDNIIDLDDYETPALQNAENKSDDKEINKEIVEPSTSGVRRMSPDATDEVPDMSDSLGLLAESSRVRRDDENDEEFDEDDDYDQYDESSNQMTAEHSEDSNAQHSEDSKGTEDKSPDKLRSFQFTVGDAAGAGTETVSEGQETELSLDGNSPTVADDVAGAKNDLEVTNNQQDKSKAADTETLKLSDTSDNEAETVSKDKASESVVTTPEKCQQSPSKTKKLEIAKPKHVLNIVELEESSSEEDNQEDQKPPKEDQVVMETQEQEPEEEQVEQEHPSDVTTVNIPTEIEIMSNSCGNTSEIVTKEGEVVITNVPKPPPHKPARLNTSEVTIKTASPAKESTLIIPETKMAESQAKPKVGLEIFNLDSDDEDIGSGGKESVPRLSALELDAALRAGRCLVRGCGAGARGRGARLAHYCDTCAAEHCRRTQDLVEGIKNMTPLLDLNMEKMAQDLVEISDSDSEDETKDPTEKIGEKGAKILEESLADIINSMWKKYKMDASLLDAKVLLDAETERLENESKEITRMLNECQTATDKLRADLYATFEPQRLELPPILIHDNSDLTTVGNEYPAEQNSVPETRLAKRRMSASNIQPAKKPAIPLGYAPLDTDNQIGQQEHTAVLRAGEYVDRFEDDKDVSVVQLSAESAPADLPPPGEPKRPPLRPGMLVYAMGSNAGSWGKARILDQVKIVGPQPQFPSFRVRFEHRSKNPCKVLSARHLAYAEPADCRLTIGTRVIAVFKEAANMNKKQVYSSGIIAEIPNPVNSYRYLVFFDDGYAQYAAHSHTRVVYASAAPVWDEVHPFSREFVRNYLCAYPERPMVRLHAGQTLNTEWNGKWWESRVIQVDASLVQVYFEEDNRTEWIYRGSTRLEPLFLELQAAVKHRGRHVPRTKGQISINMPYVEYTRSYEQDKTVDAQQQEELRRQRAVAKKSTTTTVPGTQDVPDPFASRVVYYTPRNAVRPYKMTTHTCGPKCKRTDVLTLKELRSYNPLAKPLLSGWERQLVRNKGVSAVLYRAPCGRRLRSARELHRYLRATRSDLPVDLFDFNPDTHCLAEFVLTKCIVGKKDLSHGKENVPVPCVNSVDDSLPEFCSYNTERTPTAGVPLNLDPDFLCGCDCTDDCEDKTKCACWKLTLEGAKTIGMEGPNIGYDYKRLPEPLPSGIYECNVRCKCKHTCLNRVAQHPLQLKLQVFKTPNRGWGIRALNDVPKGAFLCVYAGNLLTDATANLDGLNEGDEYLAELDYIEVVEQMKEGYEEDVPETDKILDQKEVEVKEEKTEEEESSSSEEEEKVSKNEEEDDDFMPGYIGLGVMEFNKRLRKRGKEKKEGKGDQKAETDKDKEKETSKEKDKESNADEECITISDDEEEREPSRFAAQAEMGANEHVPKYRSVRSYFGKDEACYIMDAKVQGNIGRYLNHSCAPNVFVQNVFVDTHDPRFPWVAFFALAHIRAGTELTWNYNYDVGSVPGKVLYCYCGAPNCRRRLL